MGGTNKCPQCDATFTRPQHVARHMRSHTGDRPYPCPFCPEKFARSDLLSRHRNKFHPNGANSDPPPPRYSRSKPPKPRASKAEKLKENKIELDTSLAKERVHDGQQGENSKARREIPSSVALPKPIPIPTSFNQQLSFTQAYLANSSLNHPSIPTRYPGQNQASSNPLEAAIPAGSVYGSDPRPAYYCPQPYQSMYTGQQHNHSGFERRMSLPTRSSRDRPEVAPYGYKAHSQPQRFPPQFSSRQFASTYDNPFPEEPYPSAITGVKPPLYVHTRSTFPSASAHHSVPQQPPMNESPISATVTADSSSPVTSSEQSADHPPSDTFGSSFTAAALPYGSAPAGYTAFNSTENRTGPPEEASYLPHLHHFGSVLGGFANQDGTWGQMAGEDKTQTAWRADNNMKDRPREFEPSQLAFSTNPLPVSYPCDPVNGTGKTMPMAQSFPRPPQLNPLQQPSAASVAFRRISHPGGVVGMPSPSIVYGGFGPTDTPANTLQGIKIPSLDDVKDIWKMFMQDGFGGLTPGIGPGQAEGGLLSAPTSKPPPSSTMTEAEGNAPTVSSSLMLSSLVEGITPVLSDTPSQDLSFPAPSHSFSTAISSLPPLQLNFANARKGSKGKTGSGSSISSGSAFSPSEATNLMGTSPIFNYPCSHLAPNPFGGMKREPSQELMRSSLAVPFDESDESDPRKRLRRMRSGSVGRIPEKEVWDGFWESIRPQAGGGLA